MNGQPVATYKGAVITPEHVHRVWWILKLTYGIVPIIAGLDKFFNKLVVWTIYLHPKIAVTLDLPMAHVAYAVGAIEIVAGLLVLSRFTRFGAYVVSLWLLIIAANLVSMGTFYDIAVRDLGLAIGAFCLALLSA